MRSVPLLSRPLRANVSARAIARLVGCGSSPSSERSSMSPTTAATCTSGREGTVVAPAGRTCSKHPPDRRRRRSAAFTRSAESRSGRRQGSRSPTRSTSSSAAPESCARSGTVRAGSASALSRNVTPVCPTGTWGIRSLPGQAGASPLRVIGGTFPDKALDRLLSLVLARTSSGTLVRPIPVACGTFPVGSSSLR
jgi:hypothetical protein